MNEHEQESFESELQQLRPTQLPDAFAERLADARLDLAPPERAPRAHTPAGILWQRWLRWLVPATLAVTGVIAFVTWWSVPDRARFDPPGRADTGPALRADDVEIDRQLVGTFDAVATLPTGEPIRVRCREWLDEVVLRDTERGVAIQQRTPRIEVIPVSFETF